VAIRNRSSAKPRTSGSTVALIPEDSGVIRRLLGDIGLNSIWRPSSRAFSAVSQVDLSLQDWSWNLVLLARDRAWMRLFSASFPKAVPCAEFSADLPFLRGHGLQPCSHLFPAGQSLFKGSTQHPKAAKPFPAPTAQYRAHLLHRNCSALCRAEETPIQRWMVLSRSVTSGPDGI